MNKPTKEEITQYERLGKKIKDYYKSRYELESYFKTLADKVVNAIRDDKEVRFRVKNVAAGITIETGVIHETVIEIKIGGEI